LCTCPQKNLPYHFFVSLVYGIHKNSISQLYYVTSGDFLLARRRADGHHPSVCIMKE
jgi:hypothetical protein